MVDSGDQSRFLILQPLNEARNIRTIDDLVERWLSVHLEKRLEVFQPVSQPFGSVAHRDSLQGF